MRIPDEWKPWLIVVSVVCMALYGSAWVLGRLVAHLSGASDDPDDTKTFVGGIIVACLLLMLGVLFALVRFVHWAWTF